MCCLLTSVCSRGDYQVGRLLGPRHVFENCHTMVGWLAADQQLNTSSTGDSYVCPQTDNCRGFNS
jgi:hypothetical protein